MRNRFPRTFYIPKGAIKIADKQSTAVAYLFDGAKGARPGAVCFAGKADKPTHRYTFKDAGRREQFVKQFFTAVREREGWRVQQREKRKGFVHNVVVGDIYRTSWGYDQTNVESFR